MPDIVATWDYPDEVRAFVARGLWGDQAEFPAESQALGFATATDGLVAGFVYHNWNPLAGTLEISGYSARRRWATRGAVREMFTYPFGLAGVRLVVARHSEKNTRARRIWRALGADQYKIPDLRGPGEAEVIATFSRQQWQAWESKEKVHG